MDVPSDSRGPLARLWAALRGGWLVYLGAAVLSRLGSIVLVPLYTRQLTPDQYGSYALVVSLIALLPLVLSLGLTAVVSKVFFDASDPQVARERVGTVARWMFILAGSGGAALALLAALGWPEGALMLSREHVVLAALGGVGSAFATVPESYFRAARQATKVVALQLFTFFGTTGLGVLFVAGLHRGLSGAVEAMAIVGCSVGVYALFFVLRLGGSLEPGTLARWLPLSVPFVVHFLASWLLTMGDRWVLSAQNLGGELGTYYLAVQLVSPAPLLVATWNELDAARMGEEYRSLGLAGSRASARKRGLVYFLVAVAGAVAVAVIVPFLPLVVGQRFLGAVVFVPALLGAHLLESQYFVPANLLFYAGRTAAIPVVTVTAGGLNVGLAWLLLPRFGVAGLLAARVFASFARSAMMAVAAWRLTSLSQR